MAYFQRLIKMENLFPDPKYKFENVTFGETAETMKEAIELVEKDIVEYVKTKKALMEMKDSIPFSDDLHSKKKKQPTELPAEMAGVKLPY